ncbi:hypothetical protein BV898_03734 [Hypsibius exemplaris]|uniref:Uncharacterized protein n=1 Tax=Hypsibius exemplaris TaxID=2072580 RepID=A0A1W0X4M0_HYPEX|nr:hypothetical protein BV898_03734 [Hypsibius exemplaris]
MCRGIRRQMLKMFFKCRFRNNLSVLGAACPSSFRCRSVVAAACPSSFRRRTTGSQRDRRREPEAAVEGLFEFG